ncbi:hypothetical protein VIC_001257 [Vibrio coralliilyticus ATCC BAA-450]|nr:hypothetical protein VIC_001257 [Vibrio coralliilyticus ATCC BAA-450]
MDGVGDAVGIALSGAIRWCVHRTVQAHRVFGSPIGAIGAPHFVDT